MRPHSSSCWFSPFVKDVYEELIAVLGGLFGATFVTGSAELISLMAWTFWDALVFVVFILLLEFPLGFAIVGAFNDDSELLWERSSNWNRKLYVIKIRAPNLLTWLSYDLMLFISKKRILSSLKNYKFNRYTRH